MSDTWKVHLVFTDDRSNKFWRARTRGKTLIVNYGRIGSDGQESTKDFDSAAEAAAALDKQANEKRRKGYVDEGGEAQAVPEAPVAAPVKPQSVTMTLSRGGRSIELNLAYDGQTVRTQVTETYDSAEDAAAAFVRIQQAMLADGYKRK